LEKNTLQINEAFKFRNVRWTNYVVKSHVLKGYLHDCLLKFSIIKDFKRITIYKKKLIPFNFSMTRLHKAVVSWFLSSFIPIQTKRNNSFHFIFPLLANNIQQPFRTDIFILISIIRSYLRRNEFLRSRDIWSSIRIPSLCPFSLRQCLLLLIQFSGYSIILPHLLGDLHHIQVLESGTVFDTELKVPLFIGDRISIKSQLC